MNQLLSDPRGLLGLLRRLFSDNFRNYAGRYAVAFVLMGITAVTTAFSAWLMRDVVNELFVEQNITLLWFFGGLIIAISIVKGFAAYGQTVMLSRIGNSIVARIQRQMFAKMLRLGVDFYAREHTSQLITRIGHNSSAARDAMNLVATSLGRDLFTVFALVGVMVLQDPLMAAIVLIVVPPILLAMLTLVKKIRQVAAQEISTIAAVTGTVQETARGIRIIKAFTLEDRINERVDLAVRNVEKRANKMARLQASTGPLMETLGGVAVGLVIVYAGWQTMVSGKTPGEFMAFLTAFLLAYEPAKRLARFHVHLERNLVGVRLMYEFLDNPVEEFDPPTARELEVRRGEVELEDVVFGYADHPVLHGVSLAVREGEMVALVGPSGGGKTTIVNLIQRFYRPWSGHVLIDGQDIGEVSLHSLRRQVSFVSQDTFLFTGTVRENIAVGLPGAAEADIISAARAAQAWDFISRLPEGLDTSIGEDGAQLSGGQRQRIAIARAILKNAPILLLDEATSALDTESERKVQAALDRLMEGRTTIVIAHRLSTILRADRIHVIEAGRVVESGTHKTLIAGQGTYARLHGAGEFDAESQAALAGEG